MLIKHSKYKNTGILFELLVRQITSDTLKGRESKAIGMLKKHFLNTSLGKEYKLYETLVGQKQPITEQKANLILSTILENYRKISRSATRRAKYSLIKEIKESYNTSHFFKTKVRNYKALAAIYTLFEAYSSKTPTDPNQIVDNHHTLLVTLTHKEVDENDVKKSVLNEFENSDKDVRLLTYRVLLEKFNKKHNELNSNQKQVLKEFITSVDSQSKLKDFYNDKINEIKVILNKENKKVISKPTQIKVNEVAKLLTELTKKDKINDDNLVDLLQYYQLVEEIVKANVKV